VTASVGLSISIAETKEQKQTVDRLVVEHHGYVASAKTVGRCIKYMIYWDGDLVGTFWLGSGFKPTPKDILRFFGVSQSEFDKMFNTVADNKRFCLSKKITNLGSMSLSAVRQRAFFDWKNKYGDDLRAIVTTVGAGRKGSVYLADNWTVIGRTAGLPGNRKSVSMKWDEDETIKNRFVKPTGENKKTLLITTQLKKESK
jgi:hypothetical protein